MKKDPYKTLGVAPDVSDSEIRRAHRILAKRFHPDAGEGASEERFRDIQDAYSILIDPQQRAAYDLAARTRQRAAHPATSHSEIMHGRRACHMDLRDIFRHARGENVNASRRVASDRFPEFFSDEVWLLFDLMADWADLDDPFRLGSLIKNRRRF